MVLMLMILKQRALFFYPDLPKPLYQGVFLEQEHTDSDYDLGNIPQSRGFARSGYLDFFY